MTQKSGGPSLVLKLAKMLPISAYSKSNKGD